MKKTFQDIMAEYKALPYIQRQFIRQAASAELVENGAEEVGTSDINHQIVSIYNRAGSFEQALEDIF